MKKVVLIAMFLLIAFSAQAKSIQVYGGTPISNLGLVIDASYDPRLDLLVPGYRLLSVIIMNESFQIYPLNPDADKWFVKVGNKKIEAIHDLRKSSPKVWSKLPENVRALLVYPLFLPIGARQVVDLFLPDSVPIEEFTGVTIKVPTIAPAIEVISRQ